MKPHPRLAWLYHATVKTLHRMADQHDLRPALRRWAGANDNIGGASCW